MSITETTATLNATVNPSGETVTECKFEYGTSTSYSSSAPCSSLPGSASSPVAVSAEITGLSEFFQLPGAFGDESFDRRDLPAIAAQRINEYLGAHLRPEQLIVIGDTPNDIACARHFGARVVAVATGRIHSDADLRAYDPDALLPNLLDSELVMKTLDDL